MKFIEKKLEMAFTELLGQKGLPHHLDIKVTHRHDKILYFEYK